MTTTLFVSATREEAAYLPKDADVFITGIGTMACAISLARELSTRSHLPDRLVNIGTAGALHDGLSGVFEIVHVFKHDFSSELIAAMTGRPCPNAIDLNAVTELPQAKLATGDAFISDSETRDRLAKQADLVDMEGVVVAKLGQQFGVPVTLLKQVSDSADEAASATWFDAVAAGAKELFDATSTHDLLN